MPGKLTVKKAIFFFISITLLIVALFPIDCLLRYVELKSKRYFKKQLGASFVCQGLKWDHGKIYASEGNLIKPGSLNVSFQKAVLTPFFEFRKCSFEFVLSIHGLKVIHHKRSPFCISTKGMLKKGFFNTSINAEVEEGELFLYDYTEESPFFQQLTFQFSEILDETGFKGEIILKSENGTKFTTHFSSSKNKVLKLAASFQEHALHSLSGILHYFFHENLPHFISDWELNQGFVNGTLAGAFWEGNPLKLDGHLSFKNISCRNLSLDLLGEIDSFSANFDLSFGSLKKTKSWNGEFILDGGRLSLQENRSSLWQGIWDLDHLHSDICVKDGRIESSSIKGNFIGMEGEMTLDWLSSDVLMDMKFKGLSNEMCSLFPSFFQTGFREAFPNDLFSLSAWIRRGDKKGLELIGDLNIIDELYDEHCISFGCHFGEIEKSEIVEYFPEQIPLTFTQSMSTFLCQIENQFCLSSKRIGWFEAENLPIDKFISPFLFQNIRMEGYGRIDLEGSFDEKHMITFYRGRGVLLESPSFSLYAEEVGNEFPTELSGVHYFDLSSRRHMGFLPLRDARYWQKKQDFIFTKADALVHFENEKIHIQNIETTWESLKLKGEIDVVIRRLDDVDLCITGKEIVGKVEDARAFLSHFDQKPEKSALKTLCNLPLAGNAMGAVSFKYHFTPESNLIDGIVSGNLCCHCKKELFSLEDFQASFDYNFNQRSLEFKNGLGLLHIPDDKTPYTILLPQLCFSPDMKNFINSVSTQGNQCDGEVKPPLQLAAEGAIWKGESQILQLQACSENGDDCRKIHVSGSIPFLESSLSIEGMQRNGKATIDNFSIGEWIGNGSLSNSGNICQIEHFSIQHNEKGSLAIQGTCDFKQSLFSGEVKGLEVDLREIFQHKYHSWHPQGKILGNGTFSWSKGTGIQLTGLTEFIGVEFGQIPFGKAKNVSCFFSSKQGLTIEGLKIQPFKNEQEVWELGKFQYDPANQKLVFNEIGFHLPPEKLNCAIERAKDLFPEKIHPLICDSFEALKHNEPLEGSLSVEVFPENFCIHLQLKDGNYYLSDREFKLNHFSLDYDPLNLMIMTQYAYHEQLYWLHLITDSKKFEKGKISMSEHFPDSTSCEESEQLVATWERRNSGEIDIQSIKGKFCGINANLTRSGSEFENDDFKFDGNIGLNMSSLNPLLASEFKKTVASLNLDGDFSLEGSFKFSKKDPLNFLFKGNLLGRDMIIRGIQLDELSSQLSLQNNHAFFQNLSVSDWAGGLNLDRAFLEQIGDKWGFSVGNLQVESFRLSRLKFYPKREKRERPLTRSFFVRNCYLNGLSGIFGDKKSIQGSGELFFTNLPKRTLFSNLLLLPTEITARIGLDLTSFIPVRGNVVFELREGKILLKEFQNMYSDGKRSRFYLAENYPAFVDFDGNLNLKVRMKQYNLLMKLAEFFTITVNGTLKAPKYIFTNQFEDDAKDVCETNFENFSDASF